LEYDNVTPLDTIRRYRVEMNRQKIANQIYRTSRFLLELSTVCTIAGRGLQFMARELGYEPERRRRVRFPIDD
jgi:hypothetical protein